MSQDPFERVRAFLSETKFDPLALLLDLTTLLPESLLQRALRLAQNTSDRTLQAFLIHALAVRLPSATERDELTNRYLLPAGTDVADVSDPVGKEAKRLIASLSEQQRYEVFDQLLSMAEPRNGEGRYSDIYRPKEDSKKSFKRGGRPPETKSVGEEYGGVASADPPENYGGVGGFEAVDAGFEAVDDGGFEAVDGGYEAAPAEKPDVVNLGFSHRDTADKKVQKTEPLQCRHSYYFWLRIGKDVDEAAIGTPSVIDIKKLPAEAVLTVAIFGFENELAITPGEDIGELKIQKDGSVKVQRQPVDTKSISMSADPPAEFLERHLLFPISVPDTEATYRLRCNIYCEQVLVQSHVVSANAKTTFDPVYPEACAQTLDYYLSQSLDAATLNRMTEEPHLLSLMINDNGDGSNSFRFFGDDGTERFKDDAQIDGQQLAGFLQRARGALRRVSWGSVEEWDRKKGFSYRYQSEKFDEKNLAKDLAYLASAGWDIYAGFQLHLRRKPSELEALLANSGLMQIALKLSPRAVLPAAVVYDYPWNPNLFNFEKTDFALCPSFSKALNAARNGGPPLEDCICFKGGCELKQMIVEVRTRKRKSLDPIICPSGFWGYRHVLGLPLTQDGQNSECPPVIEYKDSLQMFACVSTDDEFHDRDEHLERVKKIEGLKFERDNTYAGFVDRLWGSDIPQLLYFYCHGGVKAGSLNPFLQVGDKNDPKDEINASNWLTQRIEWNGPNPLVFINGCHTTSLNPEVTLDFVSSFVQMSGAAGVIGTEITIFEPLAVKFAEECFKRFVGAPPFKEKMPIGKAVRGARLELLRLGNPLGLVYIPYAVASLRLEQKQN